MSGLKAAQKVYKKDLPASDRVVTLGDNSPEQQQAIEKIDELIHAVEQSNDFPGDPELKEQVVAELSAGRKLLEAAKVGVAAVRETLGPPLKWIMEKSAGAAIGIMARNVWDYLAGRPLAFAILTRDRNPRTAFASACRNSHRRS